MNSVSMVDYPSKTSHLPHIASWSMKMVGLSLVPWWQVYRSSLACCIVILSLSTSAHGMNHRLGARRSRRDFAKLSLGSGPRWHYPTTRIRTGLRRRLPESLPKSAHLSPSSNLPGGCACISSVNRSTGAKKPWVLCAIII